jgi:hypothetical protein
MTNTRAINALRRIMLDADGVSPRRRIEAAEHLLDYECPEEVRVECKEFLTSIFDDDEQQVDIRLDALKLARKSHPALSTPLRGKVIAARRGDATRFRSGIGSSV